MATQKEADALARKGSSNNPSIGSELPVLISPSAGSLEIKEWLIKTHYECRAVMLGVKTVKVLR